MEANLQGKRPASWTILPKTLLSTQPICMLNLISLEGLVVDIFLYVSAVILKCTGESVANCMDVFVDCQSRRRYTGCCVLLVKRKGKKKERGRAGLLQELTQRNEKIGG